MKLLTEKTLKLLPISHCSLDLVFENEERSEEIKGLKEMNMKKNIDYPASLSWDTHCSMSKCL